MVNVSCFGRCKKKSPAWCGCDGWEKKSCKRSYASDALIHWSIGWVGERIESRFNDAHQDDECLQRGTHRSTWKAIYYCCLYCISIYPYSNEAAAFHHRTVFPPMLLKTYIPQESSKNIQAQVEVSLDVAQFPFCFTSHPRLLQNILYAYASHMKHPRFTIQLQTSQFHLRHHKKILSFEILSSSSRFFSSFFILSPRSFFLHKKKPSYSIILPIYSCIMTFFLLSSVFCLQRQRLCSCVCLPFHLYFLLTPI